MEIEYRRGKENVVADALSRLVYQMSFSIAESETSHAIREAQKTDAFIQSKWSEASRLENANDSSSSKRLIPSKFSIEQGMLKRKGRVCVPQVPSIKDLVLKDCHDSPCVGHPCIKKTLELVRRHYWWLCMDKDVLDYVSMYCLSNIEV